MVYQEKIEMGGRWSAVVVPNRSTRKKKRKKIGLLLTMPNKFP